MIMDNYSFSEPERKPAPKDTQSTECVCRFFAEPHHHGRDNVMKVSYDWHCRVHGQQHREWDIKQYEATQGREYGTVYAGEATAPPPTGAQEWEKEFDEKWVTGKLSWNGHINNAPSYERVKTFIRTQITTAVATHHKRVVEVAQTICEESEWECPDHGKEFRVTAPLCKECNQCLEVNIVIAALSKSLLAALTNIDPENPSSNEKKV